MLFHRRAGACSRRQSQTINNPQIVLPVCGFYYIIALVIFMDCCLPRRKHPRLDNYDYSAAGAYYVTICTHNKRCLLSNIVGRGIGPAEVQYTAYGKIAEEQLFLLEKRYPSLIIDQYVVMPNHIHAIPFLEEAAGASPRPTMKAGGYTKLPGFNILIRSRSSCDFLFCCYLHLFAGLLRLLRYNIGIMPFFGKAAKET